MKNSTDMFNHIHMPIELFLAAPIVTPQTATKRTCFGSADVKRHGDTRRATGSDSKT